MHQFPHAFKWLLIRGSFYFNLPSQYIYIYIHIVLFGPVKPELGVILSGEGNYSRVNI